MTNAKYQDDQSDRPSPAELRAQRERDDHQTVVRALAEHRAMFGPGVDLETVAVEMRDLARMNERERDAMIVRRMTPPSPWVDDYGFEDDRSTGRAKPARPDRPRPEPLPAEILAMHANPFGIDLNDPCVREALAIRYERM